MPNLNLTGHCSKDTHALALYQTSYHSNISYQKHKHTNTKNYPDVAVTIYKYCGGTISLTSIISYNIELVHKGHLHVWIRIHLCRRSWPFNLILTSLDILSVLITESAGESRKFSTEIWILTRTGWTTARVPQGATEGTCETLSLMLFGPLAFPGI